MQQIFCWDEPTRFDFTKGAKEQSVRTKIRKSDKASEMRDNYRTFVQCPQTKSMLFNYFDLEELEKFKEKIYTLNVNRASQEKLNSCYREFFDSAKRESLKREIE
jgi:hypothetical protein